MAQSEIPHERKRINDEIEKAFVDQTHIVAKIETWRVMRRDGSMLDLFQKFYQNFCDIVEFTGDLSQMKKKEATVTKARDWLNSVSSCPQSDNELLSLCLKGIAIYREYKSALMDQALITLPKG